MDSKHPSSEDLLQYVDRTLEDPARERVEAHLAECRSCARMAEGMERIGKGVRGLPLERTSPGFTASVMHEIGVAPAGRRQNRFLESAGAIVAMAVVAGFVLLAFFAGGVLKEGQVTDSHSAVETFLKAGGNAVTQGVDAVGGAVAPYISFLFGRGALSISLTALAVLIVLAIVDLIAGRRLMHRAMK